MKNIIILEDNELNNKLLEIMLEDFNVNITFCLDSNEFDEKFDNKYDLILLDIMVPGGKDGIEICKELVQKNIKTPIIMQSAYDNMKEDCLKIGATDFISKPISIKIFKETIKKYL